MNHGIIDPAIFTELQDSAGADFVSELVDTFLEEAPGLLATLLSAREANDADAFRRAAHSLKSNGQTFGATALGSAARKLELAGLDADPTRDAAAIDGLQATLDEVALALKAISHG